MKIMTIEQWILYKESNLNLKEAKGKAPIQNAIMINNDKRVIKLIEHSVDIKGMARINPKSV
jgi:hypothetical protein